MHRLRANLDLIVAALVVLAGILSVFVGFYEAIRYLSYLGASTILAALLYAYTRHTPVAQFSSFSRQNRSLLDASIFLLITAMALGSRLGNGVPDAFYGLLFVTSLLIALRIRYLPSRFAILHILLFAIIIRIAIWHSAPVVGRDARLHVGIVEYIINFNKLFTQPTSYYRNYPISHVTGAITGTVADLGARQALFIGVSLTTTLLLTAIVATTRRIHNTRALQAGLYAALFISIFPSHVTRTSYPIAQTLGLGLLTVLLLLTVLPSSTRVQTITVAILGVMIVTHNATPLFASIILASLFCCYHFIRLFERWSLVQVPSMPRGLVSVGVLFIAAVSTVQFWSEIRYFKTQVNRIQVILLGPGSASQDILSVSYGGTAYSLADPLLHLGIGLFLLAVLLGVAMLVNFRELAIDDLSIAYGLWTPATVVVLGLIGVSMITGGTDRVFRALGALIVFAAPILGITVSRLGSRQAGILVVCVLVAVVPILSVVAADQGFRNSLTPPTNRDVTDSQAHATASEVAGVSYSVELEQIVRVGPYLYGVGFYGNLDRRGAGLDYISDDSLKEGELSRCGHLVLYRSQYENRLGLSRPSPRAAVYDSGSTSLIRCSN